MHEIDSSSVRRILQGKGAYTIMYECMMLYQCQGWRTLLLLLPAVTTPRQEPEPQHFWRSAPNYPRQEEEPARKHRAAPPTQQQGNVRMTLI